MISHKIMSKSIVKAFVGVVMLSTLLYSCGSGNKPSSEEVLAELDSINNDAEVHVIDPNVLSGIIQSIPSPLEIAFLVKEVGGEYNKTYLNSTDNLHKYNSSYDKALNLGVYGADLAYANIFNKSQDGIFYLDAVTGLAQDLSIGQYFDVNILKELIKHNDNLDSLLLITTSNFEKINMYLQEQNRSQLSILLLTGGWIEGLNLLCEVYNKNPNDELKERIGEQKIVLEQILQLLEYYKYDENISVLSTQLKELNEMYKAVDIEVVEGEVTFEVVDGIMRVVDNSYSKVTVSSEQINAITNSIALARKGIIQE